MAPRPLVLCIAAIGVIAAACERRPPPTPPVAAAPPAPRPPPEPDAAPATATPPAPAPADDPTRFVAFDRENLRRHVALLAFARKARARLEKTGSQRDEQAGARAILALQSAQQKAIAAQSQALQAMDPQGDRSYLTADHQTNLQYLADEYPAALIGALSGDPGPLDELRTEMDRVEKKIEDWLKRVRQAQ